MFVCSNPGGAEKQYGSLRVPGIWLRCKRKRSEAKRLHRQSKSYFLDRAIKCGTIPPVFMTCSHPYYNFHLRSHMIPVPSQRTAPPPAVHSNFDFLFFFIPPRTFIMSQTHVVAQLVSYSYLAEGPKNASPVQLSGKSGSSASPEEDQQERSRHFGKFN